MPRFQSRGLQMASWAIQKNLFAQANQDYTFSDTRQNSKMFNITSKYFSFCNNKPLQAESRI